jgi:hypothetical protein
MTSISKKEKKELCHRVFSPANVKERSVKKKKGAALQDVQKVEDLGKTRRGGRGGRGEGRANPSHLHMQADTHEKGKKHETKTLKERRRQ